MNVFAFQGALRACEIFKQSEGGNEFKNKTEKKGC